METIYEWLLHNMGNEGNYLTILNVHRPANETGSPQLDIMARTKDFEVVNLLVQPVESGSEPDAEPVGIKGRSVKDSYVFASQEEAIAYFSEGQPDQSATSTASSGIQVLVLEPASNAGEIIFPPTA